jgi:hypothetical protein
MPKGLHIDRWTRGLVTNRAATSTPFKYASIGNPVVFHDALIDGSNVEISPANTLVRRPGFPKYCTATYNAEVPKGFFSSILNGSLYKFFNTDQKVYLFDTTTLTSVYTKTTTAQSFFQQVGNTVFFSDGAANKKFTVGTSSDTSVTNAGITAPTQAPSIPNLNFYDALGATQTVHAWVPNVSYTNSTGAAQNFFLLAPTGEIQWAVIPAGSTLQSQSSAPNWSTQFGVFGGTTKDGSMVWTNCGTLKTWAALTAFTNSTFVTVSQFNSVSTTNTKATSGSTANNWTVGSSSVGIGPTTTAANTNTFKITGLGLSVPAGATIKGITVSVNRAANRANAISDVTVQLLKAGVGTGSNKAAAGFWPFTTGSNVYTVPTSGGVRQNYGANNDLWGTTWSVAEVTAANFGVQFVANNASTRTTTGALVFPITVTVTYTVATTDISGTVYAQIITDSNGNLQRVKVAGTSAAAAPTWPTTIGGTVGDGTITWECLGTANQLPCLFNRAYAYSFHAGGVIAHTSTASPLLVVQAPIIGTNVPLQSFGSDDTQVDRIDVYRTADGGSTLLYDTSGPNVSSSTVWTITDSALDSDLNPLIIGPVAHANDPPTAGMTLLAYHMGRMWGVVGNLLYFSAGPDCINGDGNQAWPPANVFTLDGPINGLAPTSAGLVVETPETRSIVLGGPQTFTFWIQPLLAGRGLQSPNCLDHDGDQLAMYTSPRQFFGITTDGEEEFGLDVSDLLAANFNPASSYVAIHRSGQDQGVFISDGSTKLLRYNLNANSWCPMATPVGGIGPLASIETAIGTRSLLSAVGGFIVVRDPTVFQDSGSSYTAYGTVGSIVLSQPGDKPVGLDSIILTSAAVGSAIAVGVLLNNISGSFTNIPLSNSDPPKLAGTSFASSTINMNEYQWLGVATPLPNHIKHVQIKITFPTEAAKNEVYSMSLDPLPQSATQ